MTFRTILVPAGEDKACEARLHAARVLAWRFDAALVGLHVGRPQPSLPGAVYSEAGVELAARLAERYRAAVAEERAAAKALFQRVCGTGGATEWREATGEPEVIVAKLARTADLVVTSRPGDDGFALIEALAVGAGVPVLMLPEAGAGEIGKVVLAGWNGSREATRALHDALPFLCTAERVLLCAVGEEAIATLEPASAMLRRHGVPVRAEPVQEPAGDAGAILLGQAASHKADLVVIGAYGHSRLREMVFGGATRHLLRTTSLPLLLSA
jgi:nucleotide-binding universal stress UspA family protein